MRRAILPLLLSIGAAISCGDRGGPAADGGPGRGESAADPASPGLTVDLTPDPAQGDLAVEVRLAGEHAAKTRTLAVTRAWGDTHGAAAIGAIEAGDANGDLPVSRIEREGPDVLYELVRPPVGGDVKIRYRAKANVDRSRFGLRVDSARVSGVGHAFLLLPRIDAPVRARVRWHLGGMRAGARGASSFGSGDDVAFEAAGSDDLAHAAYVAGKLGDEPAAAGGARLTVLGEARLDAAGALSFASQASAATERIFGPATGARGGPVSFLLIAEPGIGRGHDGAYLTRSVGLWFDEARPLDAELRVVLAHELTHRWLGGSVRLVDAEGREALWFSEGFAVHFARRALFDARLLDERDFLADLRQTLDPAEGGAAPQADVGASRSREIYRRGSRYAARLDAALRRASEGARSLDDLVRALLARARDTNSERLPVTALRDEVVRRLGAPAGDELDRLAVRGEGPIELPDDAFGPCFHRVQREEAAYELGFERRSLEDTPAVVRGLLAGSAAQRAGLRDGMTVISWREHPGEIELTLGGRGSKRIRYKPEGKRRVVAWESQPCSR